MRLANFVKFFSEFDRDCECLTRDEFRVFVRLSSLMQFESNALLWEDELRADVAQSLKMSVRSLKLFIVRLEKKNFIFRNGFWIIVNSKYVKKGK